METRGVIPTRKCIDCELESFDIALFVKNKGSKYGRRNLCIACAVQRNDKEPNKKKWKTNHQTNKRYGVDVETYNSLMSSSSCCEICGKTEELCYDHCHNTMKFRGVLCRGCNRSIGQLGDSAESLQKAVDYLKKETH
jgi:hypothetical protein